MAAKQRYFIVQKADLGMYGDERGVGTPEEVNALLRDLDDDDIVVIKGTFIPTERKIATKILGK